MIVDVRRCSYYLTASSIKITIQIWIFNSFSYQYLIRSEANSQAHDDKPNSELSASNNEHTNHNRDAPIKANCYLEIRTLFSWKQKKTAHKIGKKHPMKQYNTSEWNKKNCFKDKEYWLCRTDRIPLSAIFLCAYLNSHYTKYWIFRSWFNFTASFYKYISKK